jgi:hypothetical protein
MHKNKIVGFEDQCYLCKRINRFDPNGEHMVYKVFDITNQWITWICGLCFLHEKKKNMDQFIRIH